MYDRNKIIEQRLLKNRMGSQYVYCILVNTRKNDALYGVVNSNDNNEYTKLYLFDGTTRRIKNSGFACFTNKVDMILVKGIPITVSTELFLQHNYSENGLLSYDYHSFATVAQYKQMKFG